MLWILVWDPGLRTKRAEGERRSSMSWDCDPTSLIERFDLEKNKVWKALLRIFRFIFPNQYTQQHINFQQSRLSQQKQLCPVVVLHTLRMQWPPGALYGSPRPGVYCVSDIPFDTSRNVRLARVRDVVLSLSRAFNSSQRFLWP